MDEALCGKVWQYLTLKLMLCRLSTTDNIQIFTKAVVGRVAPSRGPVAPVVFVAGRDATFSRGLEMKEQSGFKACRGRLNMALRCLVAATVTLGAVQFAQAKTQ